MSKHPDNPYWCQNHDQPKMPDDRAEWDQAMADGWITPDHVFVRMKNIADHVFGNETYAGYDDDGFMISLVGDGMSVEGGVKLIVYPNDHPPPHVHIKLRSHPDAELKVRLDTLEVIGDLPKGISTKRFRHFVTAIRESHSVLAGWWEKYHGEPVVLA